MLLIHLLKFHCKMSRSKFTESIRNYSPHIIFGCFTAFCLASAYWLSIWCSVFPSEWIWHVFHSNWMAVMWIAAPWHCTCCKHCFSCSNWKWHVGKLVREHIGHMLVNESLHLWDRKLRWKLRNEKWSQQLTLSLNIPQFVSWASV